MARLTSWHKKVLCRVQYLETTVVYSFIIRIGKHNRTEVVQAYYSLDLKCKSSIGALSQGTTFGIRI